MKEKQFGPPFIFSSEKPFVDFPHLKSIEKDDRFVVREINLETQVARTTIVTGESRQAQIEAGMQIKTLYEELEKEYNIPMSVHFVIGPSEKSDSEKSLYVVTDKVEDMERESMPDGLIR